MSEQEYLQKTKKNVQKKSQPAPAQPAPVKIQRMDAADLQRVVGNRQAGRMLAQRQPEGAKPSLFIQTKLTVGAANDAYEQEADNVAKQVMTAQPESKAQRAEEDEMQRAGAAMRMQRQEEDEMEDEGAAMRMQRQEEDEMEDEGAAMRLQRQEEDEMEDETAAAKRLQRKGDGIDMMGSFDAGEDVEKSIDSSRGKGEPLPDETRGFFEERMGHDFSGVNIHAGGAADGINREINAKAFTTGKDIFFREGAYNPGTSEGKELLAHELTHVVQQGGAKAMQPDREEKK